MGTNSFALQGREVTKHFIETDLTKLHGQPGLEFSICTKTKHFFFVSIMSLVENDVLNDAYSQVYQYDFYRIGLSFIFWSLFWYILGNVLYQRMFTVLLYSEFCPLY